MTAAGRPPSSFTITRTLEIDAAHRVPDHKSKCFNLHGHRYSILAACTGPTYRAGQQRGMVMDFGFLKECMVKVIHDPCDHGIIFYERDPILQELLDTSGYARMLMLRKACSWTDLPGWKIYAIEDVPTAENLAKIWYEELDAEITRYFMRNNLGVRPKLADITVYETPNCSATYPTEGMYDF